MKNLSFDERCYQALKTVPRGRVTTYKALAQAIGSTAYRAVGNAMNRNPFAPKVPCHRVVHSDGNVSGYAHGTKAKIKLLEKEGVHTKNGKIDSFSRIFFQPKSIKKVAAKVDK